MGPAVAGPVVVGPVVAESEETLPRESRADMPQVLPDMPVEEEETDVPLVTPPLSGPVEYDGWRAPAGAVMGK
jgi:hypothetical protein